MIHSVKIPKKSIIGNIGVLPTTLEFTDGVNIIFAPNGSGKSLLLQSIAYHLPLVAPPPTLDGGSWAKYLRRAVVPLDINYGGGAVSLVENFTIQDSHGRWQNGGDTFETLQEIVSKPSSGQREVRAINRLKDYPKVITLAKPNGNSTWVVAVEAFNGFYRQFDVEAKPTLLIDELDASLDPDKGLMFLDSVLSTLAQDFQIICVSHNPLIPLFDWYNILNFYPDQSEGLKLKINWLVEKSRNYTTK